MLRHAFLRLAALAAVALAFAAPAAQAMVPEESAAPPPPTPAVVHHSSGGGSDLWPLIGVGAAAVALTGLMVRGRVQVGGRAGGTRVLR
jgi:hypothetical protein